MERGEQKTRSECATQIQLCERGRRKALRTAQNAQRRTKLLGLAQNALLRTTGSKRPARFHEIRTSLPARFALTRYTRFARAGNTTDFVRQGARFTVNKPLPVIPNSALSLTTERTLTASNEQSNIVSLSCDVGPLVFPLPLSGAASLLTTVLTGVKEFEPFVGGTVVVKQFLPVFKTGAVLAARQVAHGASSGIPSHEAMVTARTMKCRGYEVRRADAGDTCEAAAPHAKEPKTSSSKATVIPLRVWTDLLLGHCSGGGSGWRVL